LDIVALKNTTGILFFGILPLEDVVFFFITNMLVNFGMTLLLANASQERFKEIKEQLRDWKAGRVVDPQ
jgi:hypothetical protein